LELPTHRQHSLQQQIISPYHYQTAKYIADKTLYMCLKYPYTCQINDATTFDMTDETNRFRTFNDNWDHTLFDVQDFANEGFFSLAITNHNFQCFSCGIILTEFPSHTPSFILHLLASPDCKHLRSRDDLNKTDVAIQNAILPTDSHAEHTSSEAIETDKERYIQSAGFTKITTLDTYYKCLSCHGTHPKWKEGEDPWKTHAKNFPYCTYVINHKTKFFVTEILKQNIHSSIQTTTCYRYLKNQIRCFSPEILRMDLTQLLNAGSTFELLKNLETQHDIFNKILRFYSTPTVNHPLKTQEDTLRTLKKQIECIVCMNKQRNVLLMPCAHFITCQECTLRCNETYPLCRTAISFTIFVLSS